MSTGTNARTGRPTKRFVGDPLEVARATVLRELATGPRTLTELTQGPLRHGPFKKIAQSGPLVEQLLAEGLLTRQLEPCGFKRGLKITYRLATL